MKELEPGQRSARDHFETAISAASPLLDLVLAVGERISEFAEPTDYEYYPIRDQGPDSGQPRDREPDSDPPPSR